MWTTPSWARQRTWRPAWNRWQSLVPCLQRPIPSNWQKVRVAVNPPALGRGKGLAKPVQVYEGRGASAPRTRLQAAVGRGLTRFVGRDVELEQLRRAQQLAGHSQGQVVAIVGETGV